MEMMPSGNSPELNDLLQQLEIGIMYERVINSGTEDWFQLQELLNQTTKETAEAWVFHAFNTNHGNTSNFEEFKSHLKANGINIFMHASLTFYANKLEVGLDQFTENGGIIYTFDRLVEELNTVLDSIIEKRLQGL